ncbi:MAG: hypothetical protein ACPGUU_09175, partial [Flavobacteriaceae bacterium]
MKHKIQYLLFALLLIGFQAFAQEEDNNDSKSNIQTYTPSKLLNKGQWDIKFFNNLYTENKFADANGKKQSKNRANFFTSTIEAFTGVSENNRFN